MPLTPDDESILHQFLGTLPPGRYHRLDASPAAVYRDGELVLVIERHHPTGRAAAEAAAASLVLLLNARGTAKATATDTKEG